MATTRKDPLPAFHFGVKLQGFDYEQGTAMFKSVTGLKIETDITDHVEAGNYAFTRKIIGATKNPPLEFKDGFYADDAMFKWVTNPSRCDIIVVQLGPGMKEVCRWVAKNAFPSKWEGPTYDAAKNELAIQGLTCVYEGLSNGEAAAEAPPPAPAPPPPQTEPMEPANVRFATNSSAVTTNEKLDKAAEQLKNDENRKVKVEGHTDNVGSESYNQTLSEQRANAVRDHLINQGAKPNQVTATGYGETRPIADNNTASGRAQNRRTTVEEAK